MDKTFQKMVEGYRAFRKKEHPALETQRPETMFLGCCDSRVDPAILLQCRPGDLFVARNIANIVPPYEPDESHHGTSAALEFGICYLNVKNLIIMGHSHCGGIEALLHQDELHQNDFIGRWTQIIKLEQCDIGDVNSCSKGALRTSYENALGFPWIKERVDAGKLTIHLWFFDIAASTIEAYDFNTKTFKPLDQ